MILMQSVKLLLAQNNGLTTLLEALTQHGLQQEVERAFDGQ